MAFSASAIPAEIACGRDAAPTADPDLEEVSNAELLGRAAFVALLIALASERARGNGRELGHLAERADHVFGQTASEGAFARTGRQRFEEQHRDRRLAGSRD